jgi:hypothetical protein
MWDHSKTLSIIASIDRSSRSGDGRTPTPIIALPGKLGGELPRLILRESHALALIATSNTISFRGGYRNAGHRPVASCTPA